MHIASKYRAVQNVPPPKPLQGQATNPPTEQRRVGGGRGCDKSTTTYRRGNDFKTSALNMYVVPAKLQSQSQRRKDKALPIMKKSPPPGLATLPTELLISFIKLLIKRQQGKSVQALMESCRRLCTIVRHVIERTYQWTISEKSQLVSSTYREMLKKKEKRGLTTSWANKFELNDCVIQLAGRSCLCGANQVDLFSFGQIYNHENPRCLQCCSASQRTHMVCNRCSRLRVLERFSKAQRKCSDPLCWKCWSETTGDAKYLAKSQPWVLLKDEDDTDPICWDDTDEDIMWVA